MVFDERRAYVRVEYPATGERPVLRFGERTGAVLDCSERGVRIAAADPASWPAPGEELAADLYFPSGIEVRVEGAVVRTEPAAVAVLFTTRWIPKEIIEGEQRRLRRAAAAAEGELRA